MDIDKARGDAALSGVGEGSDVTVIEAGLDYHDDDTC